MSVSPRLTWSLASREPFRLFFPLAVLVGIAGVALWPLHFLGWVQFYPGQSHARVMIHGFFGGFIIGFLGTALPRLLGAKPLGKVETSTLLLLYLITVALSLGSRIVFGDVAFLALLAAFLMILLVRARYRHDVPPPSFVLVMLALLCAAAGAAISVATHSAEDAFFWKSFQHLLSYQGFTLLPILGVGAFLLPRFFGLPGRHDFPESRTPPPGWTQQALTALAAGLLIITSFWMEAAGWLRGGPALRFIVTALYVAREVPLHRAATWGNAPALILQLAFVLLLSGFLAIVFFPAYRVSLLHLTLVGGFAVITFTVAMRVIYGHSGHAPLLKVRNRWLWVAVGLMLLGMATRMSGDFWPKVMISHYNYGAIVWIAAVILWAIYVLPKVLIPDPEE